MEHFYPPQTTSTNSRKDRCFTLFFAFLTTFSFYSRQVDAGTVKDINSGKSLIVVDLDGDKTTKGESICVYSTKNKKIDCGTVFRVKGSSAYVKFTSKKGLKKIKKGFRTAVVGEESSPSASDKNSGFKLWLSYTPGIATPAVYQNLGYAAPTSEPPETLWEPDGKVTSSLIGFGLQASIAVGPISVIPGFRYRLYSPNNVDANYSIGRGNPYVSTTTSATAFGFFADGILFDKAIGKTSSIYAGTGLDVDMSTVTIKAEKKDDTGANLEGSVATATSNLTVISLRAGGGYNLVPAKPFGISAGVNILLPLVELGKKFAGSLEENESRGLAEPGADLREQLGHKKNGFGLDAHLSVLLEF